VLLLEAYLLTARVRCPRPPKQQPGLTCIYIGVVKLDPYLEPFSDALRRRYAKAQSWIKSINETEGGVEKFSRVSCPVVLFTCVFP